MESPSRGTLRRGGSSPSLGVGSKSIDSNATKRAEAPAPGESATPLPSVLSQQAHQIMLKNWSRPISKLTVAKDLPRLSRGLKMFEDNKEEDRNAAVPKLMVALAELLDGRNVAAMLENDIKTLFTSGDIQQNLTKFFQNTPISKDSRTLRILKCFQQEMVSPAYDLLRSTVYEQFPFKDKAKTWKIQIEITPENVMVTHRKSEQSHASEPSQSFTFEWCTEFVFSGSLSSFTAHLFILDYHFPEYADANMQQKLSSLFEPRLKQTHPYQKVLNKSCADLRLLPHLNKSLPKVEVLDVNHKPLFSYNKSDNTSNNLFQLIIDVSVALGEEYDEVENMISRAGEVASAKGAHKPGEQIKEFLRIAESEGLRVVQLLKCLHPEIRAIGFRKLRSALTASGFNVRETGDHWGCTIQVLANEILVNHTSKTPGWNASHKDSSRSSSSSELEVGTAAASTSEPPKELKLQLQQQQQMFEINWSVCLAFSPSLRRFECSMSVLDFRFDGKKSEINDFKKCIQPWVSTEVQFYRLMCKDPKEYQVSHTLPKTAGQTTVYSHSTVVYTGQSDEIASYRLLSTLAQFLEPELLQKVESARKAFKTRSKASSPESVPTVLRERLNEFFLREVPFATSPVGRLLRALDRQILALAMVKIRDAVVEHPLEFIPKEKWSIVIQITARKVKVSHFREELIRLTDVSDPEETECSFTWKVQMCFDRLVSELQSTEIQVVDWDYPTSIKQEVKTRLSDYVAPLVPAHVPYERALKTPIKQCNIGSDLLYATKHMTIQGTGSAVLFVPDPVPDSARGSAIRNCYFVLFHRLLDEPLRTMCINKLSTCLDAKSDPAAGLELFCRTLIDEKVVTEDSNLLKTLRLISQVGVNPAVNSLRKEYHSQFPYRSVKGSWKIGVKFSDDGSKIIIAHTREEQSATDDPEGFFSFQWEVQLTMSLRTQKLAVRFQINKLEFQEQTSHTVRAQLLAAFKDLVGKNKNISTDNNTIPIEAVDCVRLLLQTLRSLPHPPKITRQDLRGLSSIALLEGLEKTLVQQSDKSMRVMIQPPASNRRTTSSTSASDSLSARAASPMVRRVLNATRVSLTATTAAPESPEASIFVSPKTPRKLVLSSPRKTDMVGLLPSPRSQPELNINK